LHRPQHRKTQAGFVGRTSGWATVRSVRCFDGQIG
jgi:hypothetical protein